MISCFNSDNISAEVGTKKEAESTAGVRALGSSSRQTQHCELLIWPQEHQFWPKNHPGIKRKEMLILEFMSVLEIISETGKNLFSISTKTDPL